MEQIIPFASLNGTFHLSPHENICTIALIKIHYLYTIIKIIPGRVVRTRKQSGVHRTLKVCKERARMSAVNTRSQYSVRNNYIVMPEIAAPVIPFRVTGTNGVVYSMISH